MTKKISQDTFDEVVKENVLDFEMSVNDAVQDAIEQFIAQGVDLSSVLQDSSCYLPDGTKHLTNSLPNQVGVLVDSLKAEVARMKPASKLAEMSKEDWQRLGATCTAISGVCNTDLAHRIVVAEAHAFEPLVEALSCILQYNWQILLNQHSSNITSASGVGSDLNTDSTPYNTTNGNSHHPATSSPNHNVWSALNILLTTITNLTHQQPDLLNQTTFSLLKELIQLFVNDLVATLKQMNGDLCPGEGVNMEEGALEGQSNNQLNCSSPIIHSTTTPTYTTTSTTLTTPTTSTTLTTPTTSTTPTPPTSSSTPTPPTTTTTPTNCTTFTPATTLNSHSLSTLQLCVQVCSNACFMHEGNKQRLIDSSLIQPLIYLLKQAAKLSSQVSCHQEVPLKRLAQRVCVMVRGMVSDDDIRVTFGGAHERCLSIVNDYDVINVLLGLLKLFKNTDDVVTDDQATLEALNHTQQQPINDQQQHHSNATDTTYKVLAEIMNTVAVLAVREEICESVCEDGGLRDVMEVLERCGGEGGGSGGMKSRVHLLKSSLQLIRTLSGSDKVKQMVVQKEAGSVVLPRVMSSHLHDATLCEAAALCIASVCLRHANLGTSFLKEGAIHEVVAKVMQVHLKVPSVLRACSIMVRNIASRNEDLVDMFLQEGLERLLNKAIEGDKCSDEARYALRDLRCEVVLREMWKGEGKELPRGD